MNRRSLKWAALLKKLSSRSKPFLWITFEASFERLTEGPLQIMQFLLDGHFSTTTSSFNVSNFWSEIGFTTRFVDPESQSFSERTLILAERRTQASFKFSRLSVSAR